MLHRPPKGDTVVLQFWFGPRVVIDIIQVFTREAVQGMRSDSTEQIQ